MITKFRKSLYGTTAKAQRRIVGRSASSAFERLQSPFWVGVVGVGAVLIGTAMIVFAFVALTR